jgi:hypothetical protein
MFAVLIGGDGVSELSAAGAGVHAARMRAALADAKIALIICATLGLLVAAGGAAKVEKEG